MIGRRPTSDEPVDANGWMITFADLLALLLALFVLLFSMSTVKREAWDALVIALKEQLNPVLRWSEPMLQRERQMPRAFTAGAVDLDYLAGLLREKFDDQGLLASAVVQRLDDRVVISLPAALLFRPADANLATDGQRVATALAGALNRIANRIAIVGHTDPRPLHDNAVYPSNWELSLARATGLANAMYAAGYPYALQAYGAADGRYYDISRSRSRAERHRLARRVDLMLHQDKAAER